MPFVSYVLQGAGLVPPLVNKYLDILRHCKESFGNASSLGFILFVLLYKY